MCVQVRAQLDVVSERVEAISEVGISPAHAEHILRELNSQEEKVCVRHTHTLFIPIAHIILPIAHQLVQQIQNTMSEMNVES